MGVIDSVIHQICVKNEQELQKAYQLARSTAAKMTKGNEERYDQKVRFHHLSLGDSPHLKSVPKGEADDC